MATEAQRPSLVVLYGPVIGFANLAGAPGEAQLAEDRAALAPLFRGRLIDDSARPSCHVLFLYCAVDADGHVVGSDLPLFELAKACGARFVVLASANDPKMLTKAAGGKSDWAANFVLTLDRKGSNFPAFFHALFQAMFNQTGFGLAWVGLAPQGPHQSDNLPGTIAVANIPNLAFQPDWFPNTVAPPPSEIAPLAKEIIAETSSAGAPSGLFGMTLFGKRREERHEPTLFSALGAALGYSVTQSIRLGKYVPNGVLEANKNLLLEVKGKNGQTYWYGDLINGLLFEKAVGRLDAWQVIEAKLKALAAPIPDLIPIVENTAKTLGGDDFGALKLAAGLTPREQPIASLRGRWPAVQRILEKRSRPPAGWPIDIACALVRALDGLQTLSPSDAAHIAMEAAIPMSKLPELRL